MWFYLWLRLKPSLANAIVFTIKNVAPVVLFGYAVYLAAALLIPGAARLPGKLSPSFARCLRFSTG